MGTATEQAAQRRPRDELAGLSYELAGVTWEMERRGLIRPDFNAWCRRARPEMFWDAPFFSYMHEPLNALTAGELKRVLYEVSVRHSKTESVMGYAAYSLEMDPRTRVLVGTHSAMQAKKFSRTVRRIVRSRGIEISDEADAVAEWETEVGGGMRAVGLGSGTASINADLIIIDDPIGNRKQAESQARRDEVMDAIRSDILARAEPHTRAIFSMPRWHHDDPAAHLKKMKGWHTVSLPAVAVEDDMMGRKPGQLLWPQLRPQSWVDEMREELGSYGFASLVQCSPSPREGGQFKWEWIRDRFVDAVPSDVVARCRYWDTAGTEDDGDFTAGGRMSLGTDGLYYIEHMARGQWSPGRRDREMRGVADRDAEALGGPYTFEIGIETQIGMGGKEATKAQVRALAGYRTFTDLPGGKGSKELRRDPVASQMEVGNVRIVRGDWNQALIDELLALPGGVHDDQGDALAGAFARICQPREVGTFKLRLY